jgi:hypothetical protein
MALYKVYRQGNYLEIIDTDNGQLWNVNVRDARIFRHDMSQEWFDFYDNDKRMLSKIFLTNICDKLGAAYTLVDFEEFIKCSFGLSVIGESCEGFGTQGPPGPPGTDGGAVTAWADATLESPWASLWTGNPGSFPKTQYRKAVNGQVFLRGQVRATSMTTLDVNTDAVIFTLPAGFRPLYTMYFTSVGNPTGGGNDNKYIRIDVNGDVRINQFENSVVVGGILNQIDMSLNNINFFID